MPFLAPIFAAIGGAISGALAAIGLKTVLGILLNVAMSLISYLMRPKPDKPNDMQQVFRQSAADRSVTLGRDRIGGPVIFLETYNDVIYIVQYYTEGLADYTGADVYIDQRLTPFDEEGWSTRNPTDRYVYFAKRSGTVPSTAYEKLVKDMPAYVTADFRGDGFCSGLIAGKSVKSNVAAEIYPAGIPTSTVTANWGTVYDPRTGQRDYSANLVLHMLEYLRSSNGCSIADSWLDLTGTWSKAATIADQLLTTKDGGSVYRYHGASTWKLNEKRADVLQRMSMAIDARLYLKPDGKIGISLGIGEQATVSIADNQIIEANIREGATPVQQTREVVVKWKNPQAGYTETTCRPWTIDEVTGTERKVFEAYQIQSHNHARRLAKIFADKLNPKYQGTITTTLWGMKAWDQRFIRINFDDLDIVDHVVEVTGIALNRAKATVTIKFQSAALTRYDFVAATEEGDIIEVPEAIGEKDPVTPTGVRVIATYDTSGARLEMTCNKPKRPGENAEDPETIETEWQWAYANTEEWYSLGRSEATRAQVTGIQSTGPFDVRVRHYGTNLSASPDVTVEDISPTETTLTPPPPTSVTVALSLRQAVEAEITFTTPQAAERFAGIQVWRGTTSSASAASLVGTFYRAVSGTYTVTDNPTNSNGLPDPGTYYYWVASVNWAGKRSALVAASGSPITL